MKHCVRCRWSMEGSYFIIIIYQVVKLRLREGPVLSHQESVAADQMDAHTRAPCVLGLGTAQLLYCFTAKTLVPGVGGGGSQGSVTVLECSPSQSSSSSTPGGTASNSESHCTLPRAPTDRGWPFIPPLPCDLRLPPSPQLWEAQRCARETGVRSYLQEAAPQPPPSRPPPRLALLLSLAWGWDIPGPCLRLHGGGAWQELCSLQFPSSTPLCPTPSSPSVTLMSC